MTTGDSQSVQTANTVCPIKSQLIQIKGLLFAQGVFGYEPLRKGRSQTCFASTGDRSGSSSHRSLPASTQTQVTTCCQSTSGFHAGCSSLQIQRPGARSMTSTLGDISLG